MNSLEAIKRIRQETAPATYMPDFDKEQCLKVIEKDLEVLEQHKKIEEELGIDLITLFKALKNGVYYKYKSYGYDCKISKCRKCVLTGNRTLVVDRHTYKYLCDYKKTWWLKEDRSE